MVGQKNAHRVICGIDFVGLRNARVQERRVIRGGSFANSYLQGTSGFRFHKVVCAGVFTLMNVIASADPSEQP